MRRERARVYILQTLLGKAVERKKEVAKLKLGQRATKYCWRDKYDRKVSYNY